MYSENVHPRLYLQVCLLLSFFHLFRPFQDKSYPIPGNLRALDCIPIDIMAFYTKLNYNITITCEVISYSLR